MDPKSQPNPYDLTDEPDPEEREAEEGLPPSNDTGNPTDLTYDPE